MAARGWVAGRAGLSGALPGFGLVVPAHVGVNWTDIANAVSHLQFTNLRVMGYAYLV